MNSDQYFQTVGQWQEYDESESIAEAAAMRQMEADQEHERLKAARMDKDSTASQPDPFSNLNRNPK